MKLSISLLSFVCVLTALLSGCGKQDDFPADAHKTIELGWQRLSSAEYDRAEEAFRHAATQAAPGSRDDLMARFGVANVYQHRKPVHDYEQATKLYTELATADKGGEIGGFSALACVRMQHLKLYEVGYGAGDAHLPAHADLDTVRAAYTQVANDFPNTRAADEACLYIGASHIEEVTPESLAAGIAYLKAWIAAHPQSVYVGHAWGLVASGYDSDVKRSPEIWEPMLNALLEQAKHLGTDTVASDKYYRIARIAEVYAKKPEIAREYYTKLKKDYPSDYRVFYCNRALKALGETITDEPSDATTAETGGHS